MPVAELCRKHGMSEATFYNWKSKYGGVEVSEAKWLQSLEAENAKLKRLLTDAILDNAALKDLLGKKWCRPLLAARRRLICKRSSRSASGGRAVWSGRTVERALPPPAAR